MNLTCSMLALWPIVILWSFRASVGQIKRGTDNWSSAPQAGYDLSTRFHQRSPVYNLKHEVKTSSRAIPLQSGLGSKWTVPQNWSPPRTITLSTSSSRMKIPALASRFEKGANSRPYVPKVWSSPRPNLYQRRFYSPRRRSKITATVLGPAKTNEYRHNIYQYWNHPSLGPHQRPDQTPKREVQKTKFPFQPQYDVREYGDVSRNPNQKLAYDAADYPPIWNRQTATPVDKQFRVARDSIRKTSSPFVGQNGFRKGQKLRKDWIPLKPGLFIPLYGSAAMTRNFPMIMHTRVGLNPYESSISPKVPSWLFKMQRNRISHIKKMSRIPARALILSSENGRATPGLYILSLANNYHQRELALQRELESESSQDLKNAYDSSDSAFPNVLGEVNLGGSNLISESALNQPASSNSGYRTSGAEEEGRPVPRTSYGTTSYIRRKSRLNDPKLIRLRHILRYMKKRSLDLTKAHRNDDLSSYTLGETQILHDSNDARLFDKRNVNDEIEKRFSMRKAKGRRNWGALNEFASNITRASMILLKQRKHNMRKRALQHPDDLFRNSTAKIAKGRSPGTATVEGVPAVLKKDKKREKSPSLSPENVSSNMHHALHPSRRKKNKQKHARNFINVNGGGIYFNTRNAYLNRHLAPFHDNGATERYEPFFNTRGPFEAYQMAMARRMRAMRSRGLFHSLGNINPRFFSYSPFRFPLMPVPQQFMAMQRFGLPVRNFPSEYRTLPFPSTQNHFGIPWYMRVQNRLTETQGGETEEVEKATPHDSHDQTVIPQTSEGFKTSISSQVGKGNYAESFQSPKTELSSQILKIENNRAFEGQPILNAEGVDTSNPGLDGKATNVQLTGIQVTDQSATMLNKWYPLRKGKVSLMSDPRKYTSQWPSRLPGLDLVANSDILRSRDDFPAIYTTGIFNAFYPKNYQNYRSPPYKDDVSEERNMGVEEYSRGTETPPTVPSVNQGFKFHGILGQEYIPSPVPYHTSPFKNHFYKNFPNLGRRRILRKREVRRGKTHAHKHHEVFNGPFSYGRQRKFKSSFKLLDTNQREYSKIEAGGTQAHLNETDVHNKKTVSVANDPRTQIVYPVEDPMNEILSKGYSIAPRSYGVDVSPGIAPWPLTYTPVVPQQIFRRFPLLAFPKGPPRSLMELSQAVDQFPDKVSAGANTPYGTSRQASYTGNGPARSWQEVGNQPNTVSTTLNILRSQEALGSSEKPTEEMPRDKGSEENETGQKGSQSSTFSLNANGFPEILQQSIPGFASHSYSEFPEEAAQATPENEQLEKGTHGLSDGEESYSEAGKSIDDGERNEDGESDSNFTPGLLGGLDTMQTGLLKQQFDSTPSPKGRIMVSSRTFGPHQEGRRLHSPTSAERESADLRQNAKAPQNSLLQERATFSTNRDVHKNVPGGVQENGFDATVPGRNSHMLTLPNLSLNSIEKLIDSAAEEQSAIDDKTSTGHSYGSRWRGEANEQFNDDNLSNHGYPAKLGQGVLKKNGENIHNLDWKSPLLSQSQAPFDFNWKLERALTQWKGPAYSRPDTANMEGNLADDQPENAIVKPKGSNDNPDVVLGYTFDTQGQRSVPLFLPNPPSDLANDSNAETVLMVPAPGNKAKEEADSTKSGAKKETIFNKTIQKKTFKG